MATNKHTVHTDALETLGNIIDASQGRDAIHLAVEPAKAAVKLFPSQDVALTEDGARPSNDPVGIVDPFLKSPVMPGEYFWLVVYPRTITSLRHVWVHPRFPDEDGEVWGTGDSEQWLRNFAGEYNLSLDEIIDAAQAWIREGEYFIRGGEFEGETVSREFWRHYEAYTGNRVDDGDKENFFSCSC